jgi:hypothetical protein
MSPDKGEGRPAGEAANLNTNTDQNHPTGCSHSTASHEVGEGGEGGETCWEDFPLDPQHVDKLRSSGISPLTAKFRGYETVHDPHRLDELGFAKEVCHPDHAPGLLIPQLDARGSVWGYQYRPDNPRTNAKGKPIKYESQTRGEGRRRGLDVPPWCVGDIGDPKEEKWIVEGTLKADCLAERGICAISVSGVWNWRGTNQLGGKVALPDWNDVAIEKSEFVIAYDSDVAHKKPVHAAMVQLANYLYHRAGNRVRYCHLPEGPAARNGAWTTIWRLGTPNKNCGGWSSPTARHCGTGRTETKTATTWTTPMPRRPTGKRHRLTAASTAPPCSTRSRRGIAGSSG